MRITLPSGAAHVVRRVCDAAHVEEVRAELLQQAREYRDGVARPESTMTLAQWCEHYRRSNPWSRSRASAFRRLRPLHALPLTAITDAEVGRWAIAQQRGKRAISPGYVRTCWELLRVLLLAAQRAGHLSAPRTSARHSAIAGSSSAHAKRRPLQPDELSALFAAAAADQDLWLRLQLAYYSAARPHVELTRAQWRWLRDDPSAPPGAGVIDLPACKGGLARAVPLPSWLYEALWTHVRALPPAAARTGLLFPVLHGTRWVQRKKLIETRAWKRLLSAAQLPAELVLYQLKHTRLTEVANDPRCGARVAQALAGHTDFRTTQGYAAQASTAVAALYTGSSEPKGHAKGTVAIISRNPDDTDPPTGRRARRKPSKSQPKSAPQKRRAPKASPKKSGDRARASSRTQCTPRAPNMPAEYTAVAGPDVASHAAEYSRLRAVSARVQRSGPVALAHDLWSALGALDTIAWVRECSELLDAGHCPLSSAERAALQALCAEARAMARAAARPSPGQAAYERACPKPQNTDLSSEISGASLAAHCCFTAITSQPAPTAKQQRKPRGRTHG